MSLEARFVDSARQAGATAAGVALRAVAAELIARWSEPHRSYHNLAHLGAVLDEVSPDPVAALAAWGHDAIYDPRSHANEERSAQLLASLLSRCGLPSPVIFQAFRLVLMTAGHATPDDDPAGHLLADADLAILATPWPQYLSYVDAVRAEYAHVPDNLWRIGRAAVLSNLLELPALYRLHPDREATARANLARELSTLTENPPA
jgi:predicted metal-dependent HD superfamily phosphohydrolase